MGAVKHTEHTRARMIEEYRKCGRIDLAAQTVGIDRGAHYRWLKDFPEYKAAWLESREQVGDILEDEAFRRATEGVEKPVYQGGVLVGYVREYSDSLMTWLLRGAKPEKYKDRVQQEISGPDGGAVQTKVIIEFV